MHDRIVPPKEELVLPVRDLQLPEVVEGVHPPNGMVCNSQSQQELRVVVEQRTVLAGGRTESTPAYGVNDYTKLEEGRRNRTLRSPGHGCFSPIAGRYDKLPSTYRSGYAEERDRYPVECQFYS